MAYGFGTGVQAGLGATDYSNYLRGALSGAQMEAQGTAAIGQGIGNALAALGQGLQGYSQIKREQTEKDRLIKEQESMQKGQVTSAKSFLRGVLSSENMPEDFKLQAYNAVKELDNPYISDKEKFGVASTVNDSIKNMMSLAEFGQRTLKRQAEVRDNAIISKAVQNNIIADTGAIDVQGAFQSAVEMGASPTRIAPTLAALAKLSPDAFSPTIKTLTDEATGRTATVVQTGRNQSQVLPEPTSERTPAGVMTDEARIKKAGEMRKMFEEGKKAEALDIAIGLGLKNEMGYPMTLDDLERRYGGNKKDQQPAPTINTPFVLAPGWSLNAVK